MIAIFNREEVYNGFSMQEFKKIRDCLSINRIEYSSIGTPWIICSGGCVFSRQTECKPESNIRLTIAFA